MTSSSVAQHATPLPPGTTAPDFELPSTPDQKVSLAEFRGQPVILAFYPEVWSHLAFAKDRNLHFPLLADFEPKGEVARAYHVYRAKEGTSERALYVIDADGMVRWSYVSPVGVNPGADGILRALEGLGKEGAAS
jgi:peroxiredoxin